VSPSKRLRCPKKRKKRPETTPKIKFLLPNISLPSNVQSSHKQLQTIPYTNTTGMVNTRNTNTNIMGGSMNMSLNDKPNGHAIENVNRNAYMNINDNTNGMRQAGGTMLQMLQDAAAMQQVWQGIQTCGSVSTHSESQVVFASPIISSSNVKGTLEMGTNTPQALNNMSNNTLNRNPLITMTPDFGMQPQGSHVTQTSVATQQSNINLQTNLIGQLGITSHQGNMSLQTSVVTQPNALNHYGSVPVQLSRTTQHQVDTQSGGILYNAAMQQQNVIQDVGLRSMLVASQNNTLLLSNHYNPGQHVSSHNPMTGSPCTGDSTTGYLGKLQHPYSHAIAKLASTANTAKHPNDIAYSSSATSQGHVTSPICATNQLNNSSATNITSQDNVTASQNVASTLGCSTSHASASSDNNFSSANTLQFIPVGNSGKTNTTVTCGSTVSSFQSLSHGNSSQSNVSIQSSDIVQKQTVPQHSSHSASQRALSSTDSQTVSTSNYHQSLKVQYTNPVNETVHSSTVRLRNPSLVTSTQSMLNTGVGNTDYERTVTNSSAQENLVQSASNSQQFTPSSCTAQTLHNQRSDNSGADVDTAVMSTSSSKVITPQKQLANVLVQTPGQSSTESSPASKTAEMCISSFCNISNEGGTQLTIQNNSFITQEFNRNSSNLARDLNDKLKEKTLKESSKGKRSRRELQKVYSSEKESVGHMSTVHDEDGVLPSTSAVRKEMEKDTTRKQGMKRSGSADLKENKVLLIDTNILDITNYEKLTGRQKNKQIY